MRNSTSTAEPESLEGRWGESEGFEVVKEWQTSGLTASAFCRVRGMGLQRLRYWAQRLKKAEKKCQKPDFIVLPMGDADLPAARSPSAGPVEICVREHIVVRLSGGSSPAVLVEVLRAALTVVG